MCRLTVAGTPDRRYKEPVSANRPSGSNTSHDLRAATGCECENRALIGGRDLTVNLAGRSRHGMAADSMLQDGGWLEHQHVARRYRDFGTRPRIPANPLT